MSQQASKPLNVSNPESAKEVKVSVVAKRKQDAITMAKLLYDIYKSEQRSARIISGQSNEKVS